MASGSVVGVNPITPTVTVLWLTCPKPSTTCTVNVDTPISEVAKLLHDRKLNGVIVVDEEGNLAGLLTTTNALEALIWFTQLAGA